jgi:hypothetical protein
VCLSYGVYGWAAFFLVLGALNLAGGGWFLCIARSANLAELRSALKPPIDMLDNA